MIRRSKRDIIIFYLLLILQITDIIPKTSHDIKISIMNQLHLNIIEDVGSINFCLTICKDLSKTYKNHGFEKLIDISTMLKNLEVMMEVLADSRKIGRNSALLITLNELKLFKIFKTVDQHKKNLILLKQIFMRNEGHNASLYTAESAFILTKYFEIFENLDEKIENRLKL